MPIPRALVCKSSYITMCTLIHFRLDSCNIDLPLCSCKVYVSDHPWSCNQLSDIIPSLWQALYIAYTIIYTVLNSHPNESSDLAVTSIPPAMCLSGVDVTLAPIDSQRIGASDGHPYEQFVQHVDCMGHSPLPLSPQQYPAARSGQPMDFIMSCPIAVLHIQAT